MLKLVTARNYFRVQGLLSRVITKQIADFSVIRSFLETHKLPYFTFFPKSQKPIKAVIRHLPHDTPAEYISDGLVNLGFDVISVKQMTTTRRSATEGLTTVNLPLFLITLPRTPKSQDIFQIRSLCHIAIRVEAYKAQTGLTQLQLPEIRPRLGQLQAISPLLVVWGRSPPQGMS
jgi:hypothetical protein